MSDPFKSPQSQQSRANLAGIDRWQKQDADEQRQQDEIQRQQEENRREITEFEANHVRLDDGTYVSNEIFDSLDAEGRGVLKREGISAYEKYFTEKQENELAKNNVKLNSGEWIAKETYESLPGEWQSRIMGGTEAWQRFWDSKPYGGASQFVIGNNNEVYGVTSDPNIGIDYSGMRVYLGERWTDVAREYTGKPGDLRTADVIASGRKLVPAEMIKPVERTVLPEQQEIPVESELREIDINKVLFDYESGKYYDMSNPYKPQEVDLIWENKQQQEQTTQELIQTDITKSNKPVIEKIGDIVSSVWESLTPWDESIGETNIIESLLNRINKIKSEADTKKQLAELYAIEEQMPWWYTALFGKSVIQTPDGKYLKVTQGEVPFSSPTRKLVETIKPFVRGTVTQSARQVGLSETQFTKFIQQRVINPNLTPEQFKKTQSTFDVLNRISPAAPQPMKIEEPGRAYIPQIVKARKMTPEETTPQLQKFVEQIVEKHKAQAQAAAFAQRVKEIRKANRQAAALNEAQKLAKTNNEIVSAVTPIVKEAVSSTSLTRTILASPETFVKTYKLLPLETKNIIKANVAPKVMTAIVVGNVPQLKTAIRNQIKTEEQAQNAIIRATELATRLQAQNKTAAEAKSKLQALAKTETKPEVQVLVQPIIDTLTKTLAKPQVKVQLKPVTKTGVKTKEVVKTTIKPAPKTTKGKDVPDKPPRGRRGPPPITIKLQDGTERELTEREISGSPAWKQGFMYKMWLPPYNDNSMINTKEPIPGVEYHEDAGSAVRSAVILDGELKKNLRYNMGIQDVYIEPGKSKRKPKLSFTLDRYQETKTSGIVSRRK